MVEASSRYSDQIIRNEAEFNEGISSTNEGREGASLIDKSRRLLYNIVYLVSTSESKTLQGSYKETLTNN